MVNMNQQKYKGSRFKLNASNPCHFKGLMKREVKFYPKLTVIYLSGRNINTDNECSNTSDDLEENRAKIYTNVSCLILHLMNYYH